MNIKLAALPILTIVVSATVSMQAANAGEHSARWEFAPNIYRVEQPNMPKNWDSAPGASVPASVPNNLLGVTPDMLVRKSVPAIAPMVTAKIKPTATFTKAVPLNTPFNQSFGNPISPPQVAALPKTVAPLALPAQAKKLANASVPAKPIVASRSVNAHLLSPKRRVGSSAGPALALKKVESYGNVGYIPGFTTTSTGSSASVSTNVAGTLLNKHSGR